MLPVSKRGNTAATMVLLLRLCIGVRRNSRVVSLRSLTGRSCFQIAGTPARYAGPSCSSFLARSNGRIPMLQCCAPTQSDVRTEGRTDWNSEAWMQQSASSSGAVIVARGKARLFWEGNPLVYGGAIARVRGNPAAGDIVDVLDSSDKFIAWGVYNPDSMYRVRILARDGEAEARTRDVAWLVHQRIRTARETRRAINIPNVDTDTYRLVNGEGDRLSGLVVDVFAGVLGVSSSAVWVETYRPEIEDALRRAFDGEATDIIWRRSDGRLQQDGWEGTSRSQGVQDQAHHVEPARFEAFDCEASSDSPADGGDMGGQAEGATSSEGRGGSRLHVPPTVVRELGLEYEVRPQLGQKTGFYCDQRESREAVRNLSSERTVLDMFCYSGGFALNAATGGASKVVAVDSSQPALDEARANAARNGLTGRIHFRKEDALSFMKAAVANGDKYDVVIVDPPKLAPNKRALARATSRYKRLNTAALRLVAPGGVLVTFTCSAAMTQSGGFVSMVQSAATASGRTLTLLRTVGPAADHVTSPAYPDGSYLTGALFFVV